MKDFKRSDPKYDKKFGYIVYTALILVLLLSTYVHHFHPNVFNVPDNFDVSTWEHPTFEQSLIYEQMTPEEKAKVLAEGVPMRYKGRHFIADMFTLFIGVLCFFHARKHYGFWMASCFLVGSFVFTGVQESMWILLGRFAGGSFNNPLGEPAFGSYWFTMGGFWFIECPFAACISWFYIAYSCVLIAGKVFPKMNLYLRATVGGLIAMLIDLWQDPAITSPESMAWVWGRGDFLLIFGIPHYNFIAWFLLIAVFAVLWEKLPVLEMKFGRARGTIYFFLIVLASDLLILGILFLWLFVFGNILAFCGVEHAIHIPKGW